MPASSRWSRRASRSGARIQATNGCRHDRVEFLHDDDPSVWSLDDPLDLGDLVTGSKQEGRADGTDLFVLLERGGNSFGAGGIGAFADELGVEGAESPGALGDSLVHVSEQRFGARNPDDFLQYMRIDSDDHLYLMSRFVGEAWAAALDFSVRR